MESKWFTVARLWPLLITPFVSALILIEVSAVTAILNPSMSLRLWHHSSVSIYFNATRIDEPSHIMGLFMEIKGMWNAGPPVYLITPTVCAYWDMPNISEGLDLMSMRKTAFKHRKWSDTPHSFLFSSSFFVNLFFLFTFLNNILHDNLFCYYFWHCFVLISVIL